MKKEIYIKSNKKKFITKNCIILIPFALAVLFIILVFLYSTYTGKPITKLSIGGSGVEFGTEKNIKVQDSKLKPRSYSSITKKQSTTGPNSPVINDSQNVEINIKNADYEK